MQSVMNDKYYLKRIADKTLELRLEAFGAVQIAGPKWCGKTTTAWDLKQMLCCTSMMDDMR